MTKEKQVPFPHTGILSQQNRKDLLWGGMGVPDKIIGIM